MLIFKYRLLCVGFQNGSYAYWEKELWAISSESAANCSLKTPNRGMEISSQQSLLTEWKLDSSVPECDTLSSGQESAIFQKFMELSTFRVKQSSGNTNTWYFMSQKTWILLEWESQILQCENQCKKIRKHHV